MSKVRLGDYVKIKTGKLDANAASPDGDYPFFTCAVEPLKIDKYSYDCECVLVAGNGDLNVKYYNGKFDAYQRTYIIESIDKTHLCVPYLYRFLDNYIDTLRSQSIGGVIKYIKLGNLTEAPIYIPSIETQNKTVKLLSFLDSLIEKAYQQNKKLDELVKSRFVEMFDKKDYPYNDLVSLIIEGSGLSYGIVQPGDDGTGEMGVLRPVDIVDGNISTKTIKYIDRKIAIGFQKTELLGRELLITVRGTTGVTALTDERFCGMNVTRGIAVIRYDEKKINPIYLNEYFKCEESQRYIQNNTRGATLKQINLSDLRVQQILLPPIGLQKQFADFVAQTDKSKLVVKTQIEKLETLKKSLMQEYFG